MVVLVSMPVSSTTEITAESSELFVYNLNANLTSY